MVEKSDVSQLVGRSNYELPEVRGRALVKLDDVHVAQCYLPIEHENDVQYTNRIGELIEAIAKQSTASKAEGVRVLGDTVTLEELEPFFDTSKRMAYIGFDTETTEPLALDLSITFQLIVGGPATGKTNMLRILLRQFTDNRIFISDSQAGDLDDFAEHDNITYMGNASESDAFIEALTEEVERLKQERKSSKLKARDFISSTSPTLVLIDDGDAFIEYTRAKAMDVPPLMKAATELGVCFIATTLGTKFKGMGGPTTIDGQFKPVQSAIVLGNATEASMHVPSLGVAKAPKPTLELGFWYKRGDVKRIKLPFVE